MLLVVPAILQPHLINIVLLPLSSLVADYKRKLAAMNIACREWRASSPLDETASMPLDVNIVLVSFNQAVTPAFRAAVQQLGSSVARLFIDEAHYAITAVDYRPLMLQLRHVRGAGSVQVVLMSGSVPPQSQEALCKAYNLMAEPTVVRVSTIRAEAKYVLEAPRAKPQLLQRATEVIRSYSLQMVEKERGLVYVQSIALLEEIKAACPQVRL